MKLPIVQVDAFADQPFAGNPAAVVSLPAWLDDAVLQAIAAENNLSETAFLVPGAEAWALRWFTPTVEVDLCGHATLASGFTLLRDGGDEVAFDTRSGRLWVRRLGDQLELELPALPVTVATQPPSALLEALGTVPGEVYALRSSAHASYWMAVFAAQSDIVDLQPDVVRLGRELHANVVCTAPGDEVDFVSRFFAPGSGIDEDPVTGSAHCTLAPFWADRLGRNPLRARQLSLRGGALECEVVGDRVKLRGRCALFLEGTITL